MLHSLVFSLLIFNGLFSLIAGETGCPPEEDIYPCKCVKYPSPRLYCNGIFETEILENVFKAAERYTFQEVHIKDSSMLYLPTAIFDYAYIKELYVTESTFREIFADSPSLVNGNKRPYKVEIDGGKVMRGLLSANFSSFINLIELKIHLNGFSHIPKNYSYSLPAGLKKLTFSRNIMTKISPGAFSSLPNLDKFAVEGNRLMSITRDIFPTPFNIRFLSFDYNLIKVIPDNMFHDMPNLQFLSMKSNIINTIPEAAFQGRQHNLPYLRFDENHLDCDCRILWIIKDKPEVLGGKCILPLEFIERELKDIKPEEFSC